LWVTQYIHYGTFNKVCENIINQQGDIRKIVLNWVSNNWDKTDSSKESLNRPKVLMVDEVDVFFGKDFYGNLYKPLAKLKDPTIIELTNYIWNNRNSKLTLQTIQSTSEY